MGLQLFLLLMMIFVAWASLTPVYDPKPMLINDKLAHFLTYFSLALISDNAFARSHFALKKFSWLFAFGVSLEILQQFVPGRAFSYLDMLANATGILLYAIMVRTVLLRKLTPKPVHGNF